MREISFDIPAVEYHAERMRDDLTLNDPLNILIAAEEELDFNAMPNAEVPNHLSIEDN